MINLMYKWQILEQNLNSTKLSADKEEEIIKILLKNRGLNKKKEIEAFLYPDLGNLTLINAGISQKELRKALERIKKAIKNNESVSVYTDYDADGICAGAIVWESLYSLGVKVLPYVPHRVNEGYGLSKKGISNISEKQGATLIITVDHGITAVEKIDYAKKLGIDVIIIDHHLKPGKTPKAIALIHTTRICATGVAWFFCNYINTHLTQKKFSISELESLKHRNLDLVALATIADLVPLKNTNRIFVFFGLRELNQTKRIGLNELIKGSGLNKGKLGVFEIGYILAPRINALGRLSHALDALRLLCTRDSDKARKIVNILTTTNLERQKLTESSLLKAIEIVKKESLFLGQKSKRGQKLIFISHESFQEGIIGLIAGKLVEEFNLPSIVLSMGEKFSKASARSINGFNIVESIRQARDLLLDVGGHPMAAGFTILTENITKLKKRMMNIASEKIIDDDLQKVIKIDLEIDITDITFKLFYSIQRLAPFGIGNPEPIFLSRNVTVSNASLVGKKKQHLKFSLKATPLIKAIGFGLGEFYQKIIPNTVLDIVYTINIDSWNSNSLQLKLKDVKFPER